MSQTTEDLIDAEIDAAPAFNLAKATPLVLTSIVTDLAQDILDKHEICRNYGMTMEQLLDFVRRPGITEQVKQRRAVFRSGSKDSIEDRNRAYFGAVTLDAAPVLDAIIHDDKLTPTVRLDAITLAARNAGVFNTGGPKSAQGHTQVGSQFSVNITFKGGRTEKIGTLIEADAVAVITEAAAPALIAVDDDEDAFVGDDDA